MMDLRSTLFNQLSFWGAVSDGEASILDEYIPLAVKLVDDTQNTITLRHRTYGYMNSHYGTMFLYKLARLIFLSNSVGDLKIDLCDKLFLLNRMCNCIDLFYKINMPEYFLIGHGLGTVFSNAKYGNFLVVYQNVTIGQQAGLYPEIGERVVIYPGSIIAGNCIIGDNCVIGAGTKLVNKIIPANSVVYEVCGNIKIGENSSMEILNYFEI